MLDPVFVTLFSSPDNPAKLQGLSWVRILIEEKMEAQRFAQVIIGYQVVALLFEYRLAPKSTVYLL